MNKKRGRPATGQGETRYLPPWRAEIDDLLSRGEYDGAIAKIQQLKQAD